MGKDLNLKNVSNLKKNGINGSIMVFKQKYKILEENYRIFFKIRLYGAPNRPKPNKGGFYLFNLNLLKNDLQICLRPIKGDFIY